MTVYIDSKTRGTADRPAYVVFLKYGNLPQQELILDADSREAAAAEVASRFGETATFDAA
jgi:hypothetical protein